jgi:hypothetical protein
VLLDDTEIVYPPAGAAPLSVTVPVVLFPPSTLAGTIVNDVSVGAVTVRGAETVVPFADADIVTVVCAATGDVVTVKVADVAPDGMTTGPLTEAAALFEDRLTVNPAAGAGALIVTVPVELAPPNTEVGLRLIAVTTWAVTVSEALAVPPLRDAAI